MTTFANLRVMSKGESTSGTITNACVECPTNPLIRFSTNITDTGYVCYEVTKDNFDPDNNATNGVSNSNQTNATRGINRVIPALTASSTTIEYAENLANTPGYRIKSSHIVNGSLVAGQNINTIGADTTNDYFVLINPDDSKKHHFAKITKFLQDDELSAGTFDSFEFFPKFSSEISKDTKYIIFKGPRKVDTSVVAVAYGLKMDGGTLRHANFAYISRPNFFFYDDRLSKTNQLDHNEKYMLYSSRTTGSSASHIKTTFVTVQNFGERIIDDSIYNYNIKLFDSLRNDDETNGSNDFTAWADSIQTIKRTVDGASGALTGPKRYLHYTTSPEEVNFIPHVIDVEIKQNISISGDYASVTLIDTNNIYSKKIDSGDSITIRKNYAKGQLTTIPRMALPGTCSGSSGGTTITFTLDSEQDLTTLLESGGNYENLRINDYIYKVTAVGTVSSTNTQTVTISHYKLIGGSFASGGLRETVSAVTAFRVAWSSVIKNLMVDFDLQPTVGSRIPITDLEIFLPDGALGGTRINLATSNIANKFITLSNGTTQMYRTSASEILNYYSGTYILDKKVFQGKVEFITQENEQGIPKFKIHGRNKVADLLGPIINRNYTHSEDMIYSTYGPIVYTSTISNGSANIHSTGAVAINATTITLNHHDGDASGTQAIYVGQLIFNSDKHLVGEVASFNDSSNVITLKDGALTSLSSSEVLHFSTFPMYSFSKAIQSNHKKSNSVTSLNATSNKGFTFTSGLDLGSSNKPLIGSSQNTNEVSRGFYIEQPNNIDKDNKFYCSVKHPTLGQYKQYEEHKIVNTVMSYDIIDIEQKDNKSIIELAPINPAVLARENLNRENSSLETLVDTGWAFTANVTASNFTIDGGSWADLPFDSATHQSEYIYEEDGTLIGKILWKRAKQNNSGISYNISLDRFYTSTDNAKIYRIDSYKNSQLFFLNKQGIDVGGVVQLVNPQYSAVGNRPIPFNEITSETFHGQNVYRYLDLHSSKTPSLTGKNEVTVGLDVIKPIMSTVSELTSASSSYKIYPGSGYSPSIISDSNLGAASRVLNHSKTENKPVVGSNFADAKNYSAATSTYAPHNFKLDTNFSKMDSLPKATIDTSLDWGRGNLGRQSSFREEDQGRLNAINRAKEYLEHIHKSAEKYFIFSPADLYPDSKQRETNILNGSKSFIDYNIMLYGEPTLEESEIEYEDVVGSINRANNTDENYETLTISQSSLEPSQLKRFGVMRLTELCFDWHFNVVDPENIIEHKTTIPNFVYSSQTIVNRGSFATVTGIDYTANSNAECQITDSSGHGFSTSGGQLIFYDDGNMVGKTHSDTTSTVLVFKYSENPNGIGSNKSGAFPTAGTKLYLMKSAFFSNEELVDTLVMGQGKEDTLLNIKGFTTDSHVADLSNYPNERNEGFGMYRGAVFKKDDTAANHKFDHVNFESIQLNDQNIQLPLMLQQKTSGSYVYNNPLIVQSDSWLEVEITSGQTINNSSSVRTVGTLTGITCEDVSTAGSTSDNLEVTVITEHIGGGGYNFATSKVFITDNPSGSYADGDTVKILKADIGTSGGTDIAFTVRRGTGSSGNGVLDRIHPSRVIEALQVNSQGDNTGASNFIVNKNTILPNNIYYPSRIVLFDKYNLDRGTAGSSNSPNNLNIPNFDGMCLAVGEGAINAKIDAKTGGARFSSLFMPLWENFAVGADVKAGDYIGMGAEYFFKPLLKLKVQSSTSSGVPALETTTKNGITHTTIHINNYSNYISSDGANNDHPNNYWLDFGPNLTGCYLADMNGYLTDLSDVTSARYGSTEEDILSSYSVQPGELYYVISHTIIGDSNGITHKIVLDGDLSTAVSPFLKYYRIFKPSEVCFHENTPNTLEFYTMNSEYTKKPRSNEMYVDVSETNSFQNSIVGLQGSNAVVQGESISPSRSTTIGYRDAVLSMYVIVDSDRLGSDSNYVVRDPTNFFGEDKALANGNYTFYTTDGINKRKQSFGLETFATSTDTKGVSLGRTITVPTLTFAGKFKKQLGIVSFSTPFTITTPRPTKLRKASTAKIGCSVNISLEAEGTINDILERQGIQFENTTESFEYFVGPNFQGADVYSAINYLAQLKNKRLDFHNDTIALTEIKADETYTGIYITDSNIDYKIISVSKEKSLFDYFNEISVYGRGVKSKVRDIKGIKKFGTKTLEINDESLVTQEETNTEARRLLKQHSHELQRVVVKLSGTKLKYLRVGDIVSFESKTNGIERNDFLVLGIKHDMSGLLELELGINNAGLDAKLAEILIDNKKSNAFIRGQTFKENEESAMNLIAFGLKGRKLRIRKTTSSGAFKLGFTVALNTNTSGFTLGFSGGSSSTTTLEEITL